MIDVPACISVQHEKDRTQIGLAKLRSWDGIDATEQSLRLRQCHQAVTSRERSGSF